MVPWEIICTHTFTYNLKSQNSSSAPMLGMTEWPGTLQSRRGVLAMMWAGPTPAWESPGFGCSTTPPKQEGRWQRSLWMQMQNKEEMVVVHVAQSSGGDLLAIG